MRKWLVIWALLIGIPLAWAANTQLSNLSASGAIAAGNLVYVVQSAGSGGVKATFTQVATFINSLFSQDCTVTSAGVVTCLKTNNVAFATSATTDTTNAANISSGSLPLARIGGSAASHAVPVDVAGTSTYKVIPDCTDTGGNHINYTQSTDAFSCGTSGGGGSSGPVTSPVAANWMLPPLAGTTPATGAAGGNGSLRLFPFVWGNTATVNGLGGRVGISSGGGNFSVSIYAHNSTTCRPTSTPIIIGGSLSTTSAVVVSATSGMTPSTVQLVKGTIYWSAFNNDNNTSAEVSIVGTSTQMTQICGSATVTDLLATAAGASGLVGVSAPCTFGSACDLTGATFTAITTASVPIPLISITSVP